jgi:nucleotide-binding universal stress UspA family protein
MYKHILVPTDGTALSLKAVKAACGLARATKARITALYVIAPWSPPMGDAMMYHYDSFSPEAYKRATQKAADAALQKAGKVAAAQKVRFDGATATHVQPWAAIIRAARAKKCDLVVMASHGRRGLSGLLLGSETTKVLTHSKTPVLVCR